LLIFSKVNPEVALIVDEKRGNIVYIIYISPVFHYMLMYTLLRVCITWKISYYLVHMKYIMSNEYFTYTLSTISK